MKKNTLKVAFIAAFAIVAGYNVYNSQITDIKSDLALANVEALASCESDLHYCFYRMTYTCMDISYNVSWRPVGQVYQDHWGL